MPLLMPAFVGVGEDSAANALAVPSAFLAAASLLAAEKFGT